jgi:hypothetical protein
VYGLCPIHLYLDGQRVRVDWSETIENLVPAASILAIEIYTSPAELPAEYGGSATRCGVVGVWTKRGR